jgi:hypothetical protein
MSTDRELLELAAKAAGYKFDSTEPFEICVPHKGGNNYVEWNPLTDDRDALRLAVKLGISLESAAMIEIGRFTFKGHTEGEYEQGVEAWQVLANPVRSIKEQELYKNDPYAATRRAIVRAAAAIGEQLNEEVKE